MVATPRNPDEIHTKRRRTKNKQIIECPYGVALSGASTTLSQWSYLRELENGDTYALSVRSILVFRTSRVHTYHLADDLHSPCIEADVWSDFLASIALVNSSVNESPLYRIFRHREVHGPPKATEKLSYWSYPITASITAIKESLSLSEM